MALLTKKKLNLTGVDPAFETAANGGDTFLVSKGSFLHVKNVNASARIVTVNSMKNCNQGADHDSVTTVPATTGEMIIGPFEDTNRWGDPNNKQGAITYDNEVGLTIAHIEI